MLCVRVMGLQWARARLRCDALWRNVAAALLSLPHRHHTAAGHMGISHRPPHTSFPAPSGGVLDLTGHCARARPILSPFPSLHFASDLWPTPPHTHTHTDASSFTADTHTHKLSVHCAHALLGVVSSNPTLFFADP